MLNILVALAGISQLSWAVQGQNFFGPSTLCFTVVKSGDEAKMLALQFLEGVGIFSCDDYMIFSDCNSEVLFGDWSTAWGFKRWPENGPIVTALGQSLDVSRGGPYNEPLNIPIYTEVWKTVFNNGHYKKFDWTVKMELHTVFHPHRLKDMLRGHCWGVKGECKATYLLNDGPNLHSPVEALTAGAVSQLGANLDICSDQMYANWTNQSEDAYLHDCLNLLAGQGDIVVKAEEEAGLLLDFSLHTDIPKVCDIGHSAFFPFSDWGAYMSCMGQAGYSAAVDTYNTPGQIAWTRDLQWKNTYIKPTTFCWALIQATGDEPELLRGQRHRGLGIFGCDAYMLITNTSLQDIGAFGKEAWHMKVSLVEGTTFAEEGFQMAASGHGLTSVRLNAEVFKKAWKLVFEDGRFSDYDWTVKVDPDLVIVPERLRSVLHRHCAGGTAECGPKYLQQFGGDFSGAIEAINREGMVQFSLGQEQCFQGIDTSELSESQWFEACAGKLGIAPERDANLLSNSHKEEPRPCDSVHATFHPFPYWPTHVLCLKQTGYYWVSPPPTSTSTTSQTRTTSTSTSITSTSSTRTSTSVTSTSSTHTTITTTLPFVTNSSIFAFEGEEEAQELPPWFVGWENYKDGYPLAIMMATTGLSLLLVLGLGCNFVVLSVRKRVSAPNENRGTAVSTLTPPPTGQSNTLREDSLEVGGESRKPLLDSLGENDLEAGKRSSGAATSSAAPNAGAGGSSSSSSATGSAVPEAAPKPAGK